MNADTLMSGSTAKNHTPQKNGIRIQCNTENFAPIVIPGLSTSSSSNFPSSRSMTPSRQEIDRPTSSSSSSTSPTTTVSSDSETSALEDSYLVSVSSEHVERKQRGDMLTKPQPKNQNQMKTKTTITRGDPLCSDNSEIPEWLQEFRENLVDDEIPSQGGSHASSSHEASLEPTTKRREDLDKHSVYTHFP